MSSDFPRDRRPSDIDLRSESEYNEDLESDLDAPEKKDQRSPAERDRDKILYSRQFRRLKDVTQVARAGETYLHHDRLSHSTKVAQIGRRLSELFLDVYGGEEDWDISEHLDESVVEAACLAHDIGHPPFGHLTEELLDREVRRKTGGSDVSDQVDCTKPDEFEIEETDEMEGFEGNAQSFRAVTVLAARNTDYEGMDLTRATLNAMLKYPWARDSDVGTEKDTDNKWGHYPSEKKHFDFARAGVNPDRHQTLEAEIMDYADDVTYAVHDVDDFYRGGLIPLDQILREVENLVKPRHRSINDVDIDEAVSESKGTKIWKFAEYLDESDKNDITSDDVFEFFINLLLQGIKIPDELFSPYEGTDREQEALNGVVSSLIARYLEPSITEPSERETIYLESHDVDGLPTLKINPNTETEIEILKELTFYYVISNPTLAAQQRGQEKVICELYESLYIEANPKSIDKSAIPTPYRERLRKIEDPDDPQRARIVADMIADLTETQAVRLHDRLSGETPGSLQDAIVR